MLDRKVFFIEIKRADLYEILTVENVRGIEAVLDYWEAEHPNQPLHFLAYILATIYYETGTTMRPVRETFASSDGEAIRRLDRAWAAGKLGQVRAPYWREGWFGRGPVQLTHEDNYRKASAIAGVDLVKDPGLMLTLPIGTKVTVEGMLRGLFTGKKLADYIYPDPKEPGRFLYNARRARAIINGSDRAELIASYYNKFLQALRLAHKTEAVA